MTQHRPMSCTAARKSLLDAAHTSEPHNPRLAEHLRRCSECHEIEVMIVARRQASETVELRGAVGERVFDALRPVIQAARREALTRAAQQQHRSRAPWRLAWLAAGAMAVALGTVAWLLLTPTATRSPTPTNNLAQVLLENQHGGVSTLAAKDATPRAAHDRATLNVGERLTTHDDGWASLRVGRDRISVLPRTSLTVTGLSPEALSMAIARGEAVLEIEPRAQQGQRVEVRLPRVAVTVVGTLFSVASTETHDEVRVARGAVHVRLRNDAIEMVRAGEALVIGDGSPARRALADGEATALSNAWTWHPPAPSLSTPPPPIRARDARPSPAPLVAQTEALAAAGNCSTAERQASTLRASAETNARALIAAAECYHREGNRAAALTLYERAGSSFGATVPGSNAAYESGRLAMELGDTHRARRNFTQFVRRNSRALLAGEALYRLCMLDVDEQKHRDAVQCLARYRKQFPRGARIREAWLVEATVQRAALGDCAKAVPAYKQYLAATGDAGQGDIKEAQRWMMWCEKKLGSP